EYHTGLSVGSGPNGITAGPDGALWFTEQDLGKIGRITTSGVITEFNVPGGSSSVPEDITLGPDGKLWFTEAGLDRIGRITTAGDIKRFPAPNGGAPEQIAAGSDANLWYVEEAGGNQLFRMSTSGVSQTTYTVPTAVALADLNPGPSGNMWFTDQGTNQVGEI